MIVRHMLPCSSVVHSEISMFCRGVVCWDWLNLIQQSWQRFLSWRGAMGVPQSMQVLGRRTRLAGSVIWGWRRSTSAGLLVREQSRDSSPFSPLAINLTGCSPLPAGILLFRAKVLLDPATHEGAHWCDVGLRPVLAERSSPPLE